MSGADWSNDARSTMLLGSPRDVGHGQQPPARSEMLPQTKSAIERFADRRARLQFLRGVLLGVAALVVGMLVVVLLDYGFRMGTMIRCALAISVDVVVVAVAWFGGVRASRRRDWREVALSMEAVTPELRERLLSAVELEDPRVANGSVDFRGKLQTGVASDLSKVEIGRMLPWALIRRSVWLVAGLIAVIAGVSAIPSLQMPRRMARAFVPFVPIERASFTKVEIVEPSPASAIVAEGDLVSVAAALQHLGGHAVELQWRDEDGRQGNQIMAARDHATATMSSDESPDDVQQDWEDERRFFAANVQVDKAMVHYRVVAADAETLWQTLTPMPRPRVLEFEKRYRFPSYTKLPDRVVVDQHGDLEAIVGTRADVTVRFDQPVRAAEVSFGDVEADVKVPMTPVEGDPTRFQYRVAVTTPGAYRINAVSSESGFDNPFLPRWAIDPVSDQSPAASWASDVDRRQICSPAAVLRLRGRVEDDLPMDRVIFQYARDDDSVRERSLPIDPAEDNHVFAFEWDMEDLSATGTAGEVLPAGTRLKARLIALDRAGHRGASEWLHLFIDSADFDAKRHDELFELHAFTQDVNRWWSDLDRWVRQSVENLQRDANGNEVTATPSQVMPMEELNALAERWRRIAGTASANGEVHDVDGELSLRKLVVRTNDPVAADRWVMLDRAVSKQIGKLFDVAENLESARSNVTQESQPTARQLSSSVEAVRDSLSQTQSFAGEVRDFGSQSRG
ncbi:IgA-specific metalloendopeptidase, partial [Rhodopirellula sallentina SM41]